MLGGTIMSNIEEEEARGDVTMSRYKDVILCNTTVQVMGLVDWKKAVSLVLSEKAYSIKDSDMKVFSQSLEFVVPEIIMLKEYVNDGHIFDINDSEHISSRFIKERDDYTCAYCGQYGNTIDHIIPESKGGSSKWDNVITACFSCNNIKDDKMLSELGWKLLFEPREISISSRYAHHQDVVYKALESYVS